VEILRIEYSWDGSKFVTKGDPAAGLIQRKHIDALKSGQYKVCVVTRDTRQNYSVIECR
jgi:hypothetical protein